MADDENEALKRRVRQRLPDNPAKATELLNKLDDEGLISVRYVELASESQLIERAGFTDDEVKLVRLDDSAWAKVAWFYPISLSFPKDFSDNVRKKFQSCLPAILAEGIQSEDELERMSEIQMNKANIPLGVQFFFRDRAKSKLTRQAHGTIGTAEIICNSTQPHEAAAPSTSGMRSITSKRTKNACKNCRVHKRKCNVVRPCSNCTAHQEECLPDGENVPADHAVFTAGLSCSSQLRD
jgi:hypothetical protein